MLYYINNKHEINLPSGFKEDSQVATPFMDKVTHQGKTYIKGDFYSKKLLSKKDILSSFFKLLGSFFSHLFSKEQKIPFKADWLAFKEKKIILAIYILETASKPASSPKIEPPSTPTKLDPEPETLTSLTETKSHPAPNKLADEPIAITDFKLPPFDREVGLDLRSITPEQKELFTQLINRWNEKSILFLNTSELAKHLAVDEPVLTNLFIRAGVIFDSYRKLERDTVDWLFCVIEKQINEQQRGINIPGVSFIWSGDIRVPGQANRYPNGSELKKKWNLDDLSHFLAVKTDSLKTFLEKGVDSEGNPLNIKPDNEGFYLSTDIQEAFTKNPAGRRNDLLEKNRIQSNSLRFALKPDDTIDDLKLPPYDSHLGLILENMTDEQKKPFTLLINRWKKINPAESFTLDQLAQQLKIKQDLLADLFFRLGLQFSSKRPLTSETLNWMFSVIDKIVSNKAVQKTTPTVLDIWLGALDVPGKTNRYPKGSEFETWSLDDLSRFLAVDLEKLKNFINDSEILINRDQKNGTYSSNGIGKVLEKGSPTYFDYSRTQENSLRFMS